MPKEPVLKLRPCNKPNTPWVLPIPTYLQPVVGSQKLYFKTEREGLDFIRDIKKKVQKHGTDAATMSISEAAEIAECRRDLEPYGETFRQAITARVAWLRERHKLGNRSVKEVIEGYLAWLITQSPDGTRSHHYKCAKWRLKRFKDCFAGYLVRDVTKVEVGRWLRVQSSREIVIDDTPVPKEWVPTTAYGKETVNGFHQYISCAFEYARNNGMVLTNVMREVAKNTVTRGQVSTFTPTQITQLFQTCPQELVLYFAIGAFAGLRPSEIERNLKWRDIDFKENTIFVDAHGHRSYRNRFVRIQPTLLPLLLKMRGELDEFVCPLKATALRRRRDFSVKAMGLTEWPQDVLRHSFCSYHLRHFKNLGELVGEMGHRGPDMINERYRNPRITEEAAAFYWQVSPLDLSGNKIVSISGVSA